jgi:hypothetical protein
VLADAHLRIAPVRDTAKLLYEAYIANSEGLNYQGLPCPQWDDLTPAVRSHWCASAIAATTGQPVISLRAQGVDCGMCEDNVPHIHVHQATPAQLVLALGEASTAHRQLVLDNMALKRKVQHWRQRAAQHGCNIDGGDADCG